MSTAELVEEPQQSTPEPPAPPARAGSGLGVGIVLVVVVGAIMGGLYQAGMMPRREHRASLEEETARTLESRPRVNVVVPFHRDKPSDLTLPGDIRAFQNTEIFARTDGYLKRYLVDIGDAVEAGALLAEIDTPELDQELKQAQATLVQSQANRDLAASRLELARATLRRSQALNSRGVETAQVLDENNAQFKVAESTLSAAVADITAKEANVNRLTELQKFQKIYAPYRGVIVARDADPGDLINTGMTQPLFRLAQTDQLKVYVNVPQANVAAIKVGQDAEVLVREYANRPFLGKVSRTAGAIESSSRTLLTEILLPNADGRLYAGMYVKVRFAEAGGRPLLVPATTLVINAKGTNVAIVREDDSLHYQPVQLGRDYGSDVEILQGLGGHERLVTNPTENLVEGVKVEATTSPPAK